jgi:hypothetical protein
MGTNITKTNKGNARGPRKASVYQRNDIVRDMLLNIVVESGRSQNLVVVIVVITIIIINEKTT